jgi:uncharacterized protein
MKQPRWLSRIHTLALALGALGVIGGSVLPTATLAQDIKFFRIGTGGTAGTYYPVGGLIANAISNAPGSRPCDQGGSCGVPGLVATAVASNGSVANINAIAGGSMESGFTQSDVAYWAYSGTGVYEGKTKVPGVRLIANLYPESIHLVARKGAGIRGVADLRGKRVSLDEPGSGTLVDARIIMGVRHDRQGREGRVPEAEPGRRQAARRQPRRVLLRRWVSGGRDCRAGGQRCRHRTGADHRCRDRQDARANTASSRSTRSRPTPTRAWADTKTLAVGAQWITSDKQPDDLIYEITKALWNANTRKLLDSGHAKGKSITREKRGGRRAGIPFHPGAERSTSEAGPAEVRPRSAESRVAKGRAALPALFASRHASPHARPIGRPISRAPI